MTSPAYRASVLALLLTVVFSAKAQNAGSCQQRDLVVNPRKQDKLVAGLQASSFHGSLRGQPVRVLTANVNVQPPRVVLLLDLSGSINRSNHKLDTTQFLAENIMATSFFPRVALVLFSDHIIDVVGFEHEPHAISQKLASLKDGHGSTALFDSLIYSAELFQNRESGDAIYVISDGGDSLNGLHEQDVERELLSKGIRLCSFLVSAAKPSLMTEEERQGHSDLQRLAEVTGGSMLNVEYDPYEKERRELEASLQRGYNKMKSFYDLEVELPVKIDKEQRWELQIVDERGKRQKDIAIMYPMKLVSCH